MPGTDKKHVVLVCDDLSKEGLAIFEKDPNIEVRVKLKLPLEELKKEVAQADACVVRSGTQITEEVIAAGTKLKVVGRAGVGLDNVNLEAASKRGIIVINTPGGNTISAAEHAFCLLMALARNIPLANDSLKKQEWERKKFTGVELYDKTLGVVGLGRIGTEVAKRAQAFGMHVIAYDPYLRAEKAKQLGVEMVELKTLFQAADFITLHMPLTAESRNMISEKELALMKKTVRIVNCARGGLIDEAALAKAISEKRIAAAALDVFESEPPKDFTLIKLPQVIATPHLGASTEEAQVAVAVEVAQSIVDVFNGRPTKNAVNLPHVDSETLKHIRPYLYLGEKLGLLLGQTVEGQVQQVDIQYSGEAAAYDMTSVTLAVVKGFLSQILGENVNFVNASILAKDREIKITESKSTAVTQYANMLRVDLRTDKKNYSVAATAFTKEDLRIVMIDQFELETEPEGFLLLITNNDVPGIVGQIGTLLGNNKVNIANMTLGRDVPGGHAKTLIKVDSPIPDKVMTELKSSKNIVDAKLIKL